MRYIIVSILFFLFISAKLFAQGEIEERETMFKDDKTLGVHLSSNGYGGDYRYHKRIDGFRKRVYSIDLVTIKDPKEIKRTNPYSLYQKQFIFGKMNSFFNIRAGYGMQKKVFSKMDKGWFYSIFNCAPYFIRSLHGIYRHSDNCGTIFYYPRYKKD